MFEAVRSKLVGAWRDLRSRGLVSLFFFELVVVTLGVLLAQALAQWASERADYAQMEDKKETLDLEVQRFLNNADGWALAAGCLDRRMTEIMRVLSRGETPTSEMVRRPGFSQSAIQTMDIDLRVLLAKRYGQNDADVYHNFFGTAENMKDRGDRMIYAWQSMAQVDPANGEPSAADRQQARQAASAIKALLQSIQINAAIAQDSAAELGIERDRSIGAVPFASCEELWSAGQTHNRNPS